MKQNILFLTILFFIIGCGAQNNPKESTGEDRSQNNSIMSEENLLPQTINIEFPKLIEDSPIVSFKENVHYIKNIMSILDENLLLLREVMPKITEECNNNTVCHFPKNYFIIQENTSIGEIDFIKYEPTQAYQYEIRLKLTEIQHLTYQWNEAQNDVISTYLNQNDRLALHYFNDSQNSQALYIEDARSKQKNSFIISLEETLSSTYHLRYNHIQEEHQNFSSNIVIEDEVVIDNNSFQIDKTQTIFTHLKDGDYLLLPLNSNIKNLDFINILALSKGSFSIFQGEIQGFLYDSDFSNNLEELSVFPLGRTQKIF